MSDKKHDPSLNKAGLRSNSFHDKLARSESHKCDMIAKSGNRCTRFAVVGMKKCVIHGGKRGYAHVLGKTPLAEAYKSFLGSSDTLDLSEELALQRTMLAGVLKKMQAVNLEDLKPNSQMLIMEFCANIANTAKVMSKIQTEMRETVHVEDIKVVVDAMIQAISEENLSDDVIERISDRLETLALPMDLVDVDVTVIESENNAT